MIRGPSSARALRAQTNAPRRSAARSSSALALGLPPARSGYGPSRPRAGIDLEQP